MLHTKRPPSCPRIRWCSLLSLTTLLAALWLKPACAQGKSAADYFVHSLPGAPEPLLKSYAGHIEITPEHHGNIFFWLYKNRHLADRPRTIFWLNGGPGCSSMDGALMEVGPYRINEDGTLRYNDGSWDQYANIVFVDQPVGTGFSYTDGDALVHDLEDMSAQMLAFMDKWFKIFPEFMHDDLYFAGESYAGQYIPHIGRAIADRNQGKSDHDKWNLKALIIGNGWISAEDQYKSYIPFAVEEGILQTGSKAYENAKAQEKTCFELLERGEKEHVDTYQCELIMHAINKDLLGRDECYNVYDVRLKDSYPACGMNWPPDLTQVTPYLRREDVLRSLHINPDKKTGWTECNGQVGGAFTAKTSKPSIKLLPKLLEELPIYLFSGDKDLICNHVGTENLINSLEWNGGKGMEASPGITAPKHDWTVEGEAAGQWQIARNLTYIRFYNSSHMVPFDYPRRTRDMINRVMGVDYSSIGTHPDSQIGKESAPENLPSSSPAEEKEKIDAASWKAYQRSGEAALVVVLIAACAWGFFVLRERRKRNGYKGVFSSDPYDDSGGMGLDGNASKGKGREHRDIEAAAPFDERELDDLSGHDTDPLRREKERDRFELADEEDEDDDDFRHGAANGRPS